MEELADPQAVAALRAFNRFYLKELGLLGRSYLGSGLGVTEVRVLWELGHAGPEPLAARALAGRLGLDEGYLSRVLAGFEARGWLVRAADPADRRRRVLALTPAGQAALAPLEVQSRAEVAARLAAIGPAATARLVAGAAAMRAALGDPGVAAEEIAVRDLGPGDAGWVIERHARLYAEEEGFDSSFEALVARILADYLRDRDPACERAFVAWSGGRRLGALFCMKGAEVGEARLRLFLIEPEARGRGLGRRMLRLCLDWAAARGYRRMTLWTHASHRAACALYAEAGFRLTAERAVREFGRDLVDQTWEIGLPAPPSRQAPGTGGAPAVNSPLAIAGEGG